MISHVGYNALILVKLSRPGLHHEDRPVPVAHHKGKVSSALEIKLDYVNTSLFSEIMHECLYVDRGYFRVFGAFQMRG
jgi:hypothetical protein